MRHSFLLLFLFACLAGNAQQHVAPALRNQPDIHSLSSQEGDTAVLHIFQRKFPLDFELNQITGNLEMDKGYAHEKCVPVRLDVFDHNRYLDGFTMKVFIFKATESRPQPVDFNNLRSAEWTNYGTIHVNMNPLWIQLPKNHLYQIVIHSETDYKDKFFQISEPSNLRFDF